MIDDDDCCCRPFQIFADRSIDWSLRIRRRIRLNDGWTERPILTLALTIWTHTTDHLAILALQQNLS